MLLVLVHNTFHNKSNNNASALASSPSSTENMASESKGAQNTVQKVRKFALVGIVPDHVFSSHPAVSSSIFVGEK